LATAVLAAAITIAAMTATVPGAWSRPFWGDEVASARIVGESNVRDVVDDVRRTESTPPAWYVLAWGAGELDRALPGSSLFDPLEGLRLLSVLFAAAAAVITSLWTKRLLGSTLLGAFAGVLIALGSVPAAYAEQLRAYALVTLLAVTFGVLLGTVAADQLSHRWVVLLGVVAWMGLLTHYFFAFTLAAGALWLWTSRPRPPGRERATLALGAALVGFLPWLSALAAQQEAGRYQWIGSFDAQRVAKLPASLFFGLDGLLFGAIRIAFTLLVLAGIVAIWRLRTGTLVAALGVIPVAASAVVWAAGQPIVNERNLLVVAPFLAILAAAALSRLPHRACTVGAVVGIAITVAGSVVAHTTLGQPDYRGVARTLGDFGWNDGQPIALGHMTAATSVRVAVGWYLPCAPMLVAAHGKPDRALFAVGHSSELDRWLSREQGIVNRAASFPAYDHPFRGRRNGRLLVVRFTHPVRIPGTAVLVPRRSPSSAQGSC
jgi:hypothetical protein